MTTTNRIGAQAHRVRGWSAPYFLARHALDAEDAVGYTPRGNLARREFARQRRRGIVHEAAPGEYYFDLAAYYADAEARSRHAVPFLLGGSLIIAVMALMFYRG